MMTKEQLLQQLECMEHKDREALDRIIRAWLRAQKSPHAYIEELIQFQTLGYDPQRQAYLHQMWITDELRNRMQILHGGVLATFVDVSIGATVIAELGADQQVVTLELSVQYLKPGRDGKLICETEIVKKGKTILVIKAKIWDEQEKLIATASAIFYRMK